MTNTLSNREIMLKKINGAYYEYNEDKWKYYIGYAVLLIIYFIALCFVLGGITMLTSCSTNKAVVNDSIVKVVHDSISNAVYKTEYKDRFIDHYINNTYVVSEKGDTVREKVYERITDSNNIFLKDSVNLLQSRIDSLSHIKQEKIVTTESISIFDKFKINAFWEIVFVLFLLVAIIVYQNRTFFIRVIKICLG